MFTKLYFIFLATLVCFTHGNPIEKEPGNVSQFLRKRIVGGVEAPPEYGKHMAALIFGNVVPFFVCGGSVVTKIHILTAAHCIEPMIQWGGGLMPSFRAVVGSNRWASNEETIPFSGYVSHSEWNWRTYKNDIGVLVLNKEIELNDNVAIIPLNYDWVDGGDECYVTGWGRLGEEENSPERLHLLYLRTITTEACHEGIYEASKNFEDWVFIPPHDPNLEICTFLAYGQGMCSGDSGSALVHKDKQEQIGIVSWGFPCATGAPDVFVRIRGYKDWITSIIGDYL